MRSLSASIVVLAGMVCFTAGVFIRHGGFQIFVMFTGGMVAALGLMGWLVSLRSRVEP